MAERACHVVASATQVGLIQALALMRILLAAIFAMGFVLVVGCASRSQIPPDSPISKLFFVRLQQLSGPGARACGVVPLKDLRGPEKSVQSRALSCSNQKSSDQQPFWAAFHIPGFEDSAFWEGVALTPDGKLVKLTYQYDLFDPAMEQSGGAVREFTCRTVTLDPGVGSVVVCELSANNSFKPKPLRGSA